MVDDAQLDPFSLDWGPVTPEMANSQQGIAVHVANHELGSPADVDRTCLFLRGRLAWFGVHLPSGWQQHVHLDDRGQSVSAESRASIRAELSQAQRVVFTSEEQG